MRRHRAGSAARSGSVLKSTGSQSAASGGSGERRGGGGGGGGGGRSGGASIGPAGARATSAYERWGPDGPATTAGKEPAPASSGRSLCSAFSTRGPGMKRG